MSPVAKVAFRSQNPKYPKELVTLGDYLRARRLEFGLEQRDVAKVVGVSVDTITNWELNQSSPAIRYYPRLDNFLGYCVLPKTRTAGERLRLHRVHIGYSIKELAKKLGVDPTTVQSWESDQHRPQYRFKEKMDVLWMESTK